MHRTFLRIIFILGLGLTSLSLQSCGDEGESANINISLIPEQPAISDFGISIPLPGHTTEEPMLKDIEGPFTNFRYTITNNSSKAVTILGFEVEAESTADGSASKNTYQSDFSDVSETRTLVVSKLPIAAPTNTFNETITWYFGGLQEGANRYRFKVRFYGYFHAVDDPATTTIDESDNFEDEFEKTIRFTAN